MQEYPLDQAYLRKATENGLTLKAYIEVDSDSLKEDLHIDIRTTGNQKIASVTLNDFNRTSQEIDKAVEAAIVLGNEGKPLG